MIIKKNKKVDYSGTKKIKALLSTDKSHSWSYNGQSKAYGDRFTSTNPKLSNSQHSVNKHSPTGSDLADV